METIVFGFSAEAKGIKPPYAAHLLPKEKSLPKTPCTSECLKFDVYKAVKCHDTAESKRLHNNCQIIPATPKNLITHPLCVSAERLPVPQQ